MSARVLVPFGVTLSQAHTWRPEGRDTGEWTTHATIVTDTGFSVRIAFGVERRTVSMRKIVYGRRKAWSYTIFVRGPNGGTIGRAYSQTKRPSQTYALDTIAATLSNSENFAPCRTK